MSNKNQRNRGNQQRRRRGGGRQQQAPRGPVMTALGESTYEAVFDHGNEGYGVWFDGMVRDDPTYRQHWKGTGLRPIFVKIEDDRITITRELDRDLPQPSDNGASDDDGSDDDSGSDDDVAEANADDESDGDDGDEAPAPKRRTTRRRTTKSSDDE